MKIKIKSNNNFNSKNFFHKRNNLSGFTLVESLFAILILTFTITGLMTIVSNSLFSARYAKDEITVTYLLQEVIDYVRNDRDTTVFFKGNTWDSFYAKYRDCGTPALPDTYGCYFNVFDTSDLTIKQCPNGVCPFLYYDKNATNGSFYNYNESGVITNFRRKIVITKDAINPGEIIITVTVNWKNGSFPMERSLSTSLTNWQQL